MLELALLSIIIFSVVSVVLIEFVYEKWQQSKIEAERQKHVPQETVEPQPEPEELIEEEPEFVEEVEPEKPAEEFVEEEAPIEEPEPVIEEAVEVEEEAPVEEAPAKELPACEYPEFTHVRLVEMGLSDDEAKEFVNELIPQLEEQVPLIEASINDGDFHQIERLTHGIKGSATNIGTGGVSDLLVEFNTYVKSGEDVDILKAYHKHFVTYIEALKEQYS